MFRFRRFFVFLTTHSEPETGYLHTSPSGHPVTTAHVGLYSLYKERRVESQQILRVMFFETRFGKLVKGSRDSVLALLSCGAAVEFLEARKAFNELTTQ